MAETAAEPVGDRRSVGSVCVDQQDHVFILDRQNTSEPNHEAAREALERAKTAKETEDRLVGRKQ